MSNSKKNLNADQQQIQDYRDQVKAQNQADAAALAVYNEANGIVTKPKSTPRTSFVILWCLFLLLLGIGISYLILSGIYETYQGSCHSWSLKCIGQWTGRW